jgi:hypothetical protein
MGKTLRIIIDPKANRTTSMSSIARPAPACGNRCSMPRGKALYPLLMAELDAMKALRPRGGLMLRRDGSGLPWGGQGRDADASGAHLKRPSSLRACVLS